MPHNHPRRKLMAITVSTLIISFSLFPMLKAGATHSWANFHWKRSANPITLTLIDSLTSDWDSYLADVSFDWSTSTVIDTVIEPGASDRTSRKKCTSISGKIRVCNSAYGRNGWLGLATIWIDGDHITKATVKVNDSYFNLSYYNNTNAKRHVMCQEVGHDFGLDHQHLGDVGGGVSCMNDTAGLFDSAYVLPNAHDYEQLELLYAHMDASQQLASSFTNATVDVEDDEDNGRGLQRIRFIYPAE